MGHQGTNHPWTGVKTVEAFISCHLTYQRRKQLSSGVWVNFDHPNSQDLTVKVKLTNAPVGTTTYELEQLLSTGEVYPVGLAEAIYGSLTALQYQFNHTILEQPFTTIIKPGKHALNVSGGATAWATMNAMVQEVTIDLLCSPSAGLTVAKTQVRCGPVEHLEPGQLVQLTNLFCNRDLSKINPNERTSGLANGGQNAAMPSDTAKENSTQITPDAAQQMFSAPDMVISTNTNGLLTDPANGQIVLNHYQNTSSTPVAMGYLPPQYRGAGAPSTTTLAANVQYCQYSRYLDTSANAEWVCTTAGTNSTSAWAQLSGGGGGMNFRGYWVSTTNYALSDVVVLQSGVSAGLYISLIAANSNNPATGTGWMQLAPGNLVGSWT
jgi:hypothetical protein